MLIFKCKMCGGDLELIDGKSIAECQHCGTVQTLPAADNEKKIRLFNQANKLRMALEFDRAASIYENIIAEYPEDAEGYWGLCLCNYGIEYVKDPATGERKPTCNRASFEKLIDDENFKNALDFADMNSKRQYTIEAREIDRITEEILSISKNEKPYDIFICYKETDENKERTVDSLMGERLYNMLTDKGYKVFFSRISLEDKVGIQYEPYIFAALNSAKIMLCIGTKYEHFHAVWVKNEWGRFLRLAAKDKSKFIFPCYKDCDPYIDLPQEFKALQAQDLGKPGAEMDLIRGIEKIIGKKQEEALVQKQVVVNTATGATTETFLTRAKLSLEAGDFSSVNKFCESALNMDPENSDAYYYKLLADLKLTKSEDLPKGFKVFTDNVNYQRAYRFGDQKRKEWLKFCADSVVYNIAEKTMVSAESSYHFNKAAQIFNRISNFKDAAQQAAKCLEFKRLAELEEEERRLEEEERRKESIYQSALASKTFDETIKQLELIPDYKDSKKQISDCALKAIDRCNDSIKKSHQYIVNQKKICAISRLNISMIIIFIVTTIMTVITAFNDYNDVILFISAWLALSCLFIVFASYFCCAYIVNQYEFKYVKIQKKDSIIEGFRGIFYFWETWGAWDRAITVIKEERKLIAEEIEKKNTFKSKLSPSIEDIEINTEDEIEKINKSYNSFLVRVFILVCIPLILVFVMLFLLIN